MANKRKRPARAMSGNQLAATVRDSAQQIWLAGLGAYSTAQVQGNKMFEALAREGETIQSRARRAIEARTRTAAARAEAARRRLEKVLEDSVRRALKRFGVATSRDIDVLSQRVAALTALVKKTTAARSARPTAAKRAARGR